MRKKICSLHILTLDLPDVSHSQQVQYCCEAGALWIQLRVKNKTEEEWLRIAKEARAITTEFGATLIINDSPSIAKTANADGVHLGQTDMTLVEARKILGEEKIIGLSVHNERELLNLLNAEVDYIGVGPFKTTTTKKNHDPVLGLSGLRELIYSARSKKIFRPMIAIGGVQPKDIHTLFSADVNGVAVSSAIHRNANPKQEIKRFHSLLETFHPKPEISLS